MMSHTSRPNASLSHRTLRGAFAPTFLFCLAALGSAHAANFEVDNFSDPSQGTCTADNCSLRAAISAAQSSPGADTIIFGNLFEIAGQTITLGAGELTISSDLTITGPTRGVTIDADSKAINAADLRVADGVDQRGLPRTVSGRADIGAFEFQNQSPVATNHTKTLARGATLALTAADFTDAPFYTDAENDPLLFIQITQLPDSQSGILKLGDNVVPVNLIVPTARLADLKFMPAPGFEGSASFQYKVADSGSYSGTAATFGLQVLATSNNAPTISDIANQTTNQNTPLGPLAFTIADNDTPLSSLSVNATSSNQNLVPNSALALGGSDANRTLTIAPASGQSGSTIVTVTVSDGSAESSDTFVLQVLAPNAPPPGVNQAPIAASQLVSVQQDTSLFLILTGSDVDTPEANLTYRVASLPAHGSLSGAAPNLNYTPDNGFSGADSFTFVVNDGALDSNVATVSITVRGDNTPPVEPPVSVPPIAVDDSYTLVYGPPSQVQSPDVTLLTTGVFQINAPGLLGNDRDNSNRDLSVRLATYPSHGRIQVRGDGSFFYLPSSGFAGADEFTYTLDNGQNTATGKVRLRVIDRFAPELRFDTPRDGSTLSSVTAIKGRARDKNSGLKSIELLWQRFDGKFWNGSEWTTTLTELPLKVDGINWSYTGDLPAFGADAATDLLNGVYQLRATATDNSGNVTRVINRITVGSGAPAS